MNNTITLSGTICGLDITVTAPKEDVEFESRTPSIEALNFCHMSHLINKNNFYYANIYYTDDDKGKWWIIIRDEVELKYLPIEITKEQYDEYIILKTLLNKIDGVIGYNELK